MRHVLGIDVASSSWLANGSALISYDDAGFRDVVPGAIKWPLAPLTPEGLADAIDAYAREKSITAVALDGPQGWRSADTPLGTPGVGRRCEYECRTQGKTGVYPVTYPRNQRPWIEFSVKLFDALLARHDVVLAESETTAHASGYAVLECFPTSTWRASGMIPLPGKGKRPALAPFIQSLRNAYQLPDFKTESHDDLQAVVAALAAVAAAGGPALPLRRGVTAMIADARRNEGFIWDATPKNGYPPPEAPSPLPPQSPEREAVVYVTRGVLDHLNRTSDPKQMQIVITGVVGATAREKRQITLSIDGDQYTLILGDSHAIWPTHQNAETTESFEQLFSMLADRPGEEVTATIVSE